MYYFVKSRITFDGMSLYHHGKGRFYTQQTTLLCLTLGLLFVTVEMLALIKTHNMDNTNYNIRLRYQRVPQCAFVL